MNAIVNPVRIDTRAVLRAYSAVAIVAGAAAFGLELLLSGGGFPKYPVLAWGLGRVAGSVAIAAGCFAIALARVEDPESRRRGLGWLALGHGVVAVAVLSLQVPSWNSPWSAAVWTLVGTAALLLFYGWQFGEGADGRFASMVSLFGEPGESGADRLRSAYERGIREAAAQEERNRLARDLHDSIKQQLFAIHTAAAAAQERLHGEPADAGDAIGQIRASARAAMSEMDALLHGLRAAPLENVGLIEALKQSCEALAFRTGARVDFSAADVPPSETLPPGSQEAVFRVSQEALANIARHARAGHVEVRLAGDGGGLTLTIEDDGAGFDHGKRAGGLGIANMRARAAECCGHIELVSHPGAGTSLRLTVPGTTQDPGDASYYLRRAVMFVGGATLFFFATVVFLERSMLVFNVPVLVLMLAQSVHELLAYRRVRQARELRP